MPDLTPLAASVGALLKERQENIAVADSSAGGLISASLLSVSGASAYYVGIWVQGLTLDPYACGYPRAMPLTRVPVVTQGRCP